MADYEINDGVGIIPDSETRIQNYAFSGCESLKSASVLGPVKSLNATSDNCVALESVTLGNGIKKMRGDEGEAFNGCTSLKTIYVPAKKSDYYKKRLPSNLHSLIIELSAEKKAKK